MTFFIPVWVLWTILILIGLHIIVAVLGLAWFGLTFLRSFTAPKW